jgi:putative SOS response-associated peptidase YedK
VIILGFLIEKLMCGRFVQIIDIELFVKRFGVVKPDKINITSSFNVAPGDLAYVITNEKPNELQEMQFGLTPSWAKKQMYLINARAEGDFNSSNDVNYNGQLGIVNKPSYRTAIRSQRCLVIANAFYEGPAKEKLNKPYKFSKKDEDVFCFAGIWDTWADDKTGSIVNSFSIITTVANEATSAIGHPRSPVILNKKDEAKWLDTNLPLEKVVNLLKPFPGELLKTEPVSIQIKDPKNKGKELLIPIDPDSTTQYDVKIEKNVRLEGMGSGKRKSETPPPMQGSLF